MLYFNILDIYVIVFNINILDCDFIVVCWIRVFFIGCGVVFVVVFWLVSVSGNLFYFILLKYYGGVFVGLK